MSNDRFVKAVSDSVANREHHSDHLPPDLIPGTSKFRTCTPTPDYFFSSESDLKNILRSHKISEE